MGGSSGSSSQSVTKYNGIQIQSSLKGIVIPFGWGTFKVGTNLIDYLDFKATKVKEKTPGKGGLFSPSSDGYSYTYSATLLLGICAGPISSIRTVWQDQSVYTSVGAANFNLALGAIGQPVWPYLTTADPTHALGYSGLAYFYAENYSLGDSASTPDVSIEVVSNTRQPGFDDANPGDIASQFLAGVPQWPIGIIDPTSLANFANYCTAAGLFLSPVLDSARQASDFLTEILTASNSDCVWSDGVLKFVPYGDTAISGNGVNWSPNLTQAYDLTFDDIIPPSDGADPIKWDFKRPNEAYNYVQVEFLDRSQQYATDIAPAVDQANIDEFGRRKSDPQSLHSICDSGIAYHIAQLMVQRTCNVRRTCTFTLPETFGLLEPLVDLVTVPLRNGGTRLVRLTEIDEKDNGTLDCTGEEMLVGVSHTALYSRQSAGGYVSNFDADPGDASPPLLINPPMTLTGGDLEAWIAVSGTSANWGGCDVYISLDDTTFQFAGTILGGARYGVSTASFASGSDPDLANTLSVDLTASNGELVAATQAQADGLATLSMIGSELVSYENAVLTSAFNYDLSYLRRGAYNTLVSSYPAGTPFVRLDDAIFKYPYTNEQLGATIYVKLQSFNIYKRNYEDLDGLASYPITLGPTAALGSQVTGLALAKSFAGGTLSLIWNASFGATIYKVRIFKADQVTLVREIDTTATTVDYLASEAALDGIQRSYAVQIVASNTSGDASPSAWLAVNNPAPAAVSISSATGGATNATINWGASSDPDLAGYALYYSTTSGFNPLTAGYVSATAGTNATLYGLAAGTYYCVVAPYDPWTDNPSFLNFSAQSSFTITTGGGGGTPSGGGGSPGGYVNRPHPQF